MEKKRILEIELMLKRTPEGRHIGESLLEKIEGLVEQVQESTPFSKCKLCGLQMDSNSFQSGCPNCGCKDIEDFENRSISTEQNQIVT